MFAYWLVLLIVILLASLEKVNSSVNSKLTFSRLPFSWVFAFLLIVCFIGLRFEVGGDWDAYLTHFNRVSSLGFIQVLLLNDPGYQVLSYIADAFGGSIINVNLMAGLIFTIGLMTLCTNQPRPMLSLVTALPYMTIVLAMGYTRQACALGFAMIAIQSLIHKTIFKFSVWIIIAALFHKSAVLLIPVAALLSSRSKIISIIWVGLAAVFSYFTLLSDSVEHLYSNYVESGYQSQGAMIRIAMCLLPSVLYLYYRDKFTMTEKEKQLWLWFSLASIIAFVLLFISSASTAIDRVALYLLPIQLVIFSHIPEVLGKVGKSNSHWVWLICLYYALVQFVWLFFASHNFAWLPYQFYPFTLL